MTLYEGLFALLPDLSQDENKKLVSKIEEQITKAGGMIESSQDWGRRTFAYPIRKKREGVYHLLHFRIAPEAVAPLKRACRLNESILNSLITRLEG